MHDLGIGEIPPNNSISHSRPVQASSLHFWNAPPIGTFKLNVDGVAKGNPGPARYCGVIINSKGGILSLFWGSLGTNTNNMAELVGLINDLNWAKKTGKTPLVVEGDSQIIINIAHRLQAGSLTTQVSKN